MTRTHSRAPRTASGAPACSVCGAAMSLERYYSPTQAKYVCGHCGACTRVAPVVREITRPMMGAGRKVVKWI